MTPEQIEKSLRGKLKGLYAPSFQDGLRLPNLYPDEKAPSRLPLDMIPKQRRAVSKPVSKDPLE